MVHNWTGNKGPSHNYEGPNLLKRLLLLLDDAVGRHAGRVEHLAELVLVLVGELLQLAQELRGGLVGLEAEELLAANGKGLAIRHDILSFRNSGLA